MSKSTDEIPALQDPSLLTELGVDPDRFGRQIRFLIEIDRLKTVVRQTYLADASRRENAAEHSWHIALAAMIFSEYANHKDLDLGRAIQMLLVHDLIEIDAGDTYCYDRHANQSKTEREQMAADRIFNLLPADQADQLRRLWQEFEDRRSPESRFANALDRVQPFLHNYVTRGKSWREHNIHHRQVSDRMQPVAAGARVLWDYVCRVIKDAVERGFLR